jgi:hypothetical protein
MKQRWAVAILLAVANLSAVKPYDPWTALSKATTLRCAFDQGSQSEWDKGKLTITTDGVRFGEGGVFTFDSISLRKHTAGPCELPILAIGVGRARIIGNGGGGDVLALLTMGSLTFVETTSSGSVIVTTVFEQLKPGTLDYIAVQSRNISGLGDLSSPMPSQYHGTCRVMP